MRKTKALLRDAQLLVEKTQNEGTNKVILRQLKNQVNSLFRFHVSSDPNLKGVFAKNERGIVLRRKIIDDDRY